MVFVQGMGYRPMPRRLSHWYSEKGSNAEPLSAVWNTAHLHWRRSRVIWRRLRAVLGLRFGVLLVLRGIGVALLDLTCSWADARHAAIGRTVPRLRNFKN